MKAAAVEQQCNVAATQEIICAAEINLPDFLTTFRKDFFGADFRCKPLFVANFVAGWG